MWLAALQIFLWLLCALTPATQKMVRLNLSPRITAECGKKVTLNCDVSSSQHGLSIKRMEWSQNNTILCSVGAEGKITMPHEHTLSDFHCEYKHGQLFLIFRKMQPLESENSNYRCKLQSNQGVAHKYTTVELQECCGLVEGVATSEGYTCTFKHVHPGGDVHWFHGSHTPKDKAIGHADTTKNMNRWGWWTIRSSLKTKSSEGPYNCSLMSAKSGQHIASTLVQDIRSGVGTLGPIRILLCISIYLLSQ